MAGTSPGSDQARQLLMFYAPEVTRLALAWLDANPGQDAVGIVTTSGEERPDGFVGVTHEEVARGVVERTAAETFLRRHAPSALERIGPPARGKQTTIAVFALLDGAVSGGTFPIPGRS